MRNQLAPSTIKMTRLRRAPATGIARASKFTPEQVMEFKPYNTICKGLRGKMIPPRPSHWTPEMIEIFKRWRSSNLKQEKLAALKQDPVKYRENRDKTLHIEARSRAKHAERIQARWRAVAMSPEGKRRRIRYYKTYRHHTMVHQIEALRKKLIEKLESGHYVDGSAAHERAEARLAERYVMALSEEQVKWLVVQPCHYCGAERDGDGAHGIDRIDNRKGYIADNCVTSCFTCNRMKHSADYDTFLATCRVLGAAFAANAGVTDVTLFHCSSNSPALQYKTYETRAPDRGYEFSVSKGTFMALLDEDCSYCGRPTCNGVDREDNNVGYTMDNCVPCCGTCNWMKYTLPADHFRRHVQKIATHISRQ